ncbi:MAG: type II toxin-antitoxin system RelE/ParE family toxin [Defluviitaleaceae bacterium]|nr:type II toxin-antitoxin system RelE/ParE family toxin [Defluviitaleaceae bacterium]
MSREFIVTKIFDKRWLEMGLDDDDLRKLENYLINNPGNGDIIQGTGGAKKLRWSLPNTGKSGGIRIIHIDFIKMERIYLITCYPKSKKDNLTNQEKGIIKEMIIRLKNERVIK